MDYFLPCCMYYLLLRVLDCTSLLEILSAFRQCCLESFPRGCRLLIEIELKWTSGNVNCIRVDTLTASACLWTKGSTVVIVLWLPTACPFPGTQPSLSTRPHEETTRTVRLRRTCEDPTVSSRYFQTLQQWEEQNIAGRP